MLKDYASSHVRQRKQSSPPWRVIVGIACIVIVCAVVWMHYLRQPVVVAPVAVIQPIVASVPAKVQQPVAKPRFDFYRLLPEAGDGQPQVEVVPEVDHVKLPVLAKAKKKVPVQQQVHKTVKPALPAPAKPTQARHYFLQIASFIREADADKMKARLLLLGFSAKVDAFQGSKAKYYRVILGPFDRMDIAEQVQKRLAQAHYKSLLLTIKQRIA